MRNYYLLIIICLISGFSLSAQDVVWVKNKVHFSGQGYHNVVNASDNSGNFYECETFTADSVGNPSRRSYFTKYDNNGNLLISKLWSLDFLINDMKYDGGSRLFATGVFTGNITVDGHTIIRKGMSDAFLAELDLLGNIISIKTFGGKKDDYSNGIYIKPGDNKIYITGSVTDTVQFEATNYNRAMQSMFIASFTKPETLIGFHFFDFSDSLNNVSIHLNSGREITADNNGNIFVLHSRDADNYYEPYSGDPAAIAAHIMKLNSSYGILWSTDIVGGSFCGTYSLKVNQTGDVFVLKNCGIRYDFQATLLRLNNLTGTVAWETSELGLYDIQIDNSNSVILIAHRDLFPYSDGFPYDVLMKFNANNNVLWEKKLYDFNSSKLTLDYEQNIYLSGAALHAKIINGGMSPLITTGIITGSPFNPGASISVPFTVSTAFASGNVFTAQLSDPFGSFKNSTTIGTLSSTASGNISAIIPLSALPGTNYRIRVIGANPLRYGKDNGSDLTIIGSQTFINSTASWKYLDNGTNQGTAWRGLSFSDGAWKTGNAQLGYGDGDEATIVSYGSNALNKYITTYFRKIISISNPTQFTRFELSLLKDDGAVVYLNGVEILRSNMPAGTIYNTSLASSAIGPPAENAFTTYTIASSKFVNGNNTIAVEVHQASAGSSDLSFNLKLNGIKPSPTNDLISANSLWNYDDTGEDLGNNGYWTFGYNAFSTKSGNAELGYGDGDEATIVSYGPNSSNKYITTYFRKKFNADANEINAMKLELIRDDGAVVYLNGSEIFRNNMPINFNSTTLALTDIDGATEKTWIGNEIPIDYLRNGENIIGVEIHQSSAISPDISFNLRLSPVKPAPVLHQCLASGSILREQWTNIPGKEVALIPINAAPTSTSQLYYFEGPSNVGDNYGSRIRGFVCPPSTGYYTFWIASDDNSELWLSTDSNTVNKVKIASLIGWALPQDWNKYPSQKSAPIYLIAGGKYYIEALHKEDVLGDNIAVGWQLPNGSYERPIAGNRLSPAKITPPPVACAATGNILREHWANITGREVAFIPVNTTPTSTSQLTIFESPSNIADNYGARIRGYVCPPTTGNYTFWIASDDNSELWLSTDNNPANKVKIASLIGWALPLDWNKYPSQKSSSVYLIAGNKYYIEALHKEDVQGDNIAVGWQLPDASFERPIPGNRLSPYISSPGNSSPTASITSPLNNATFASPANITINASASDADGSILKVEFFNGATKIGEDLTAPYSLLWSNVTAGSYALTVKSTDNLGSSGVSAIVNVSVSGCFTPIITPLSSVKVCTGNVILSTGTGTGFLFQWQKDGVNITNATSSTYTATVSGNYQIKVINGSCVSWSAPLTVSIGSTALSALITAGGPTTFCSGGSVKLYANTCSGFTYQWIKNSVAIAGATASTYTATTGGSYQLKVNNGTTNAWSSLLSVTVNTCIVPVASTNLSSTDSLLNKGDNVANSEGMFFMKVFPNPNNGIFSITVNMTSLSNEKVRMRIMDELGKIVYDKETLPDNGNVNEAVDLDKNLPSGIYTLQVIAADKIENTRVIIAR